MCLQFCADSWLHFLPLTVSEKKYLVLYGLKEQQNLLMCSVKSLKNATKRRNFDHLQFARVWLHWKASSHINIYESLKILVIFLFRHHTNSVKLLLSVFGHGWLRWKWITIWKRLGDVFKFCACILQKSLKTYYGLLSLQKFTWYLLIDVPGAFCVWVKAFNLNFSEVLTKRKQNPRDTAPSRPSIV